MRKVDSKLKTYNQTLDKTSFQITQIHSRGHYKTHLEIDVVA